MPHLVLFNRKSVLADDDTRMPAQFHLLLRTIQFSLSLPLLIYLYASDVEDRFEDGLEFCEEKAETEGEEVEIGDHVWVRLCFYAAFSFALSIAAFTVFIPIYILSGKGSPTETEKRMPIRYLCHVHLTVIIGMSIGAFCLGLSLIGSFYRYCDCVSEETSEDGSVDWGLRGLRHTCEELWSAYVACFIGLVVTHLIDMCYAGFFYLVFIGRRLPGLWIRMEDGMECCCKCCFTCLSCLTCFKHGGGYESLKSGELENFSSALSDFVGDSGGLDYTVSDIMAGLNMVRLVHLKEEMDIRDQIVKELEMADDDGKEEERKAKSKNRLLKSVNKLRAVIRANRSGRGDAEDAEDPQDRVSKSFGSILQRVRNKADADGPEDANGESKSADEETAPSPKASLLSVLQKAREKAALEAQNEATNLVGNTQESKSPIQSIKEAEEYVDGKADDAAGDLEKGNSNGNQSDIPKNNGEECGKTSIQIPATAGMGFSALVDSLREKKSTPDFTETSSKKKRISTIAQQVQEKISASEENDCDKKKKKVSDVVKRIRRKVALSRALKSLAFSHAKGKKASAEIRRTLSPKQPDEKFLIAEGARFIAAANAIYIWPAEDIEESSCGTESAIKVRPDSDHTQRILTTADIQGVVLKDIIHAQYKAGVCETPYAILIDRVWRSIVVTIRGTSSLDDLLADLTINPRELSALGEECGFDGKGKYCHSGILACTEWIYRDLESHKKLDKLLKAEDSWCKGYDLKITGHSLGAGCAVMLTLLLRGKYPNARCVAFSPPGCSVSRNLADECSAWATSFVLDSDIIPRSSMDTLETLRDEALEMIARIRIPKYQVFANNNIDKHGSDALREFLSEALVDKDKIPDSPFYKQLKEFRMIMQEKKKKKKSKHVPLFPPGRLVQLIRRDTEEPKKTKGGCFSRKAEPEEGYGDDEEQFPFTARWIERDDLGRIVLTSHLTSDHQTDNIISHFCELAAEYKLKQPYASVLPQGSPEDSPERSFRSSADSSISC